MTQISLFDETPAPPSPPPSIPAWMLCPHTGGVRVESGGWTLAVTGPYAGFWVHAHPSCLKPAHLQGRHDV